MMAADPFNVIEFCEAVFDILSISLAYFQQLRTYRFQVRQFYLSSVLFEFLFVRVLSQRLHFLKR